MSPSDYTILFAEDNPSITALYMKAFTKEGYKVLTCDNAAQAMAEIQDEEIDLLVTDLAMPAANTFELFPFLKEKYPKLPVIIVSGKYQDLKTDFLDKGFKVNAFLQKPVELSALKAKVAEVLKVDPTAKAR